MQKTINVENAKYVFCSNNKNATYFILNFLTTEGTLICIAEKAFILFSPQVAKLESDSRPCCVAL
jgi:hypothetical protein